MKPSDFIQGAPPAHTCSPGCGCAGGLPSLAAATAYGLSSAYCRGADVLTCRSPRCRLLPNRTGEESSIGKRETAPAT
ncbi:hypothetical protein E2562_029377 [Oryza meyeriana var. granulata]|uniref:Uncharacterized protein n=1 Tax=Oryza meyeriana var. granulata TaxID=110450 RepID=A0A6G1C163_9ORYZ|nr:hypothetical protein E2562_029377 [Oryza meyeriana var. granulata]